MPKRTTLANRGWPRGFGAIRIACGVVAVALLVGTAGAQAATSEGGEDSETELAKKTQNPVADLISVPFQNNFNFGAGSENKMVYNLNIQPVIPISVTEDWNVIARIIVPLINQPSLFPGAQNDFALGDINPTFFLSPSKPGKFIWGIGPTATLATASSQLIGSGRWSAGPAAVGLFMDGHWVVGALANQQWDFAGWTDKDVNGLLVQPFVNYNIEKGWYLTAAPIITGDFTAHGGNIWTVPLGGGGGKLWRIGKVGLPVNTQLQAFYNVATPDFAADWQLRAQVQFLFPK